MNDQNSNDDEQGKAAPSVGLDQGSTITEWFYAVEDNRCGPVSAHALIEKIRSGGLDRKTKVWKEGLPKWILLENTPFCEFLAKASPPPLDHVDNEGPGEVGKPPPRPSAIPNVQGVQVQQLKSTKQYKIYENRAGNREAVKQGWSWPAFLFTWIWAFMKKMNATGASVLAAYFFLTIFVAAAGVAGGSDDEDTAVVNLLGGVNLLAGLVNLAIMCFFGVNGNAWREKNLLSRAYEFKKTVSAQTDEAALARYMEGRAQ